MNGSPRPLGALLLFVGLLPAALRAQEPHWQRVGEAYPPGTVEQIRGLVDDAAARGVPPEPILDKALEGAAKGVAPALVLRTLAEYAARLERGGGLVGEGATLGELVAASDALRRGVPEGSIRQIASGPGESSVALVVLGDLVEMGVPVGRAEQVIAEALGRGADGERLLRVPGSVRRLMREGAPPAEAASRIQEAMARGGPPMVPPGRGRGPGMGAPPTTPPVPPGAGPPGRRGRGPGGA